MFTEFDPKIAEAFEQLKYANGDEAKIQKSALLPCYRAQVTINGQKSDVICFDRQSPLLNIAELKKQFVTYDADLLDIPKQNNTVLNITLKNYTMRRVQEIKLHKMTPVITFDDIFQKCRLENSSRKKKLDARNAIMEFLEYLKSQSEIKNFELTKRGNSFYSVKFFYTSKSPSVRKKI